MTTVAESAITVAGAAEMRLFHSRRPDCRVQMLGDIGEGRVEAYVSVFGVTFWESGFFTRRKVRIGETAFANTLRERQSFPIVFEHDWDAGPIGHTLSAETDEHGLKIVAQLYTDDAMGRRVWRAMDAGALDEWSIGFYARQVDVAEDDDGDEVTTYTDVDLAEMSVVFRGANPETETISVQTAQPAIWLPHRRAATVTLDFSDGAVRVFEDGGLEQHGAIPPHSTPVVDRPWDGPAAEAAIPNDAGRDVLRQLYAWVDPDGDPDTKAAYALPHHEVTNGRPGAANVRGVRNALARLPQSRIPQSDHEAVRRHLQRHLDDFNERSEGTLAALAALARRPAWRRALLNRQSD